MNLSPLRRAECQLELNGQNFEGVVYQGWLVWREGGDTQTLILHVALTDPLDADIQETLATANSCAVNIDEDRTECRRPRYDNEYQVVTCSTTDTNILSRLR